jgi:hypothetical protein
MIPQSGVLDFRVVLIAKCSILNQGAAWLGLSAEALGVFRLIRTKKPVDNKIG